MANKADKTVKKIGKAIPILGSLLCALAVVMIIVLCLPKSGTGKFTPPPFDENAVSGVPEVAEELGYSSPYKDGMCYRFSVCGNVTVQGSEAIVYLTNPAENDVWLKIRVLDASGRTVGETGLIRPGEYVRCVTLSAVPADGAPITLKIMGYEPETYQSAGAVTLGTAITCASK